MKELTTISIDTAKDVFHLCLFDQRGKVIGRQRLRRNKLSAWIARQLPCQIYLEACGGSHYWGRTFEAQGHRVGLIAPQFVKPFRKSGKNDAHDAEAAGIAGQQASMRFVGIKNVEQQAQQQMHRMRERLKRQRLALVNQQRGFLLESGIVIAKSLVAFRRQAPEILEDGDNGLTGLQRQILADAWAELRELDQRLSAYTAQIKREARNDERARVLQDELPGVGPLTATALLCGVADPRVFHNGRQFSAWLGLVPRQFTTGGKPRLGAIHKRGSIYMRQLLIHGARSVIRHLGDKQDRLSCWLRALVERRGKNKAAVALANKTARQAWVLMCRGC